uniref:Uncharacterized protein n=1 Tax=Oryza meridionalis TaxID=40149 RepID=A0A0E0EYR9_9ORYZ
MAGRKAKKGKRKGKRKQGDAVGSSDSEGSGSSSGVAAAAADEGTAVAAGSSTSGAAAEGVTGNAEVAGDVQLPEPQQQAQLREWKKEEKDVLGLLVNRAKGRKPWWGVAVSIYKFKYGGVDCEWYNGQTFLNTSIEDKFTKDKPREVSVWTCPQDKRHEVELPVSLLWGLNHSAIMKPIFTTHNKDSEKIVVGFTRFNMKFHTWINNQKVVKPDGYLPFDGVVMISSVLGAISEALKKNCKFVGLDNKFSYVMLDYKIKILPFNIRRGNDDKDADRSEQLLAFSDLLFNELHPKWQDPDLKEFITLMRKPDIMIDQLLEHPLLLPPDIQELSYRKLWLNHLSFEQGNLLYSSQDYNHWKQNIPQDEAVLIDMLNSGNYLDTFAGAFEYGRDTSSHYMTNSRRLNQGILVPPCTVDSKLKKALPGLISKIYSFSLNPRWSRAAYVEDDDTIYFSSILVLPSPTTTRRSSGRFHPVSLQGRGRSWLYILCIRWTRSCAPSGSAMTSLAPAPRTGHLLITTFIVKGDWNSGRFTPRDVEILHSTCRRVEISVGGGTPEEGLADFGFLQLYVENADQVNPTSIHPTIGQAAYLGIEDSPNILHCFRMFLRDQEDNADVVLVDCKFPTKAHLYVIAETAYGSLIYQMGNFPAIMKF